MQRNREKAKIVLTRKTHSARMRNILTRERESPFSNQFNVAQPLSHTRGFRTTDLITDGFKLFQLDIFLKSQNPQANALEFLSS